MLVTVPGVADLTTVTDGVAVVVTSAVEGSDVTDTPAGVLPEAVAELWMVPALKSAAVAR